MCSSDLPLLLLALGSDPLARRDRLRDQAAQLRDRFPFGLADQGRARQEGDRRPGPNLDDQYRDHRRRGQQVTNDTEFGKNVFQISTKDNNPTDINKVQNALDNKFGLEQNGFDSNSIGPTFGKAVAKSAMYALIFSILVICGYVAFRFEPKYAIPVLIALFHDILITGGVYSLSGREVSSSTVAAFLTILGYSLYDTVIVFDRVRENVPRLPRAAFSQVVNRSMSEVLTRSLITGLSTVFLVGVLYIFGGATLKDFAFAMGIGILSGGYSSIFIASPVLTHWKEREPQYRARRRRLESELGHVPAYAEAGADVEPTVRRRRPGRLTEPDPDNVSQAEFEEMKRDIQDEPTPVGRGASTVR